MLRLIPMAIACVGLIACETTPVATKPGPSSATSNAADTGVVPGRGVRVIAAGLSCPLCAHNIDKSMRQLPGVADARVNLDSGAVDVTLDGSTPVTYEQLARIVRDNGFTLVGFEPWEGGRP